MPDNQINLVYKLDGDVHEVDVFQLAPTLLALGELIQESNREVNPGGRQIGVNVKPFREGSFIVDLTVFPQTHLQQFLDLISNHPVDQIKTVLEWVGLIAGTPFGAVQLVKWLKGKPKSVQEVGPGEFRYTAFDDRSITVAAPVHQLISNSNITNNIYKVYAAPIEQQISITDVKTYIEDRQDSEVIITKDEVPALKEYLSDLGEAQGTEIVKEHTHHGVYLNPKRGAFDGDPKEWSFRRGGSEVIVATIKDRDFLEKCTKGEYRLNHSDLLIVDLLEKQRIQGTTVLKPLYEILRVTSYIKGPEQAPLNIPPS
jgi:hypothetical protein